MAKKSSVTSAAADVAVNPDPEHVPDGVDATADQPAPADDAADPTDGDERRARTLRASLTVIWQR